MQWTLGILNVHNTIRSVDMMYEIQSQVVNGDTFKMLKQLCENTSLGTDVNARALPTIPKYYHFREFVL